jgi:RimJ/RimL family protein N-acetyltransferase
VEIGFRLFKKYQKKGFASESVSLACNYIENVLKKQAISKTYKQNESSQKVLLNNCFEKTNEDKKYFYFTKK